MPDIRHAIQIAAAPAKIYPLIATAKGLAEWWAADVTELPGGAELGFFNRNTVYRLKLQIDQPLHVDWLCESGDQWGGTHLIFTLEPAGNNTQLRFTHAGWREDTDYFVSCTTTWGELMFRLKAAAEGKATGPLFLAASMAY